jgi:hypothetical protein
MTDSLEDLIERSELVIVGNADPAFAAALDARPDGQHVIDLVRLENAEPRDLYEGIAW